MAKYIDADKLLKLLNACKYPVNKTTRREMTYNASISDARRCVDAMPAADVVEVRHGRWVPIKRGKAGYSAGDFKCTECGKPNKCYSLTPFCPNCGASMQGEEE